MITWHRVPCTASGLWQAGKVPRPVVGWLGQAGFILRAGNKRLLIDPYLSDSLEAKYRGTDKPHDRLMPAPVSPLELTGADTVLCTHRHTDHMDGETLRQLAGINRQCRFVIPRAELDHALGLGLPKERLLPINADEAVILECGLRVKAVAAAHETVETTPDGNHRYLGFIVNLPGATVYHSGDTVPFEGLVGQLRGEWIDLALLPVNGRGKGVAGNLTFAEAVALCGEAGIRDMIPHHFGMFAFNTIDAGALAAEAATVRDIRCHLPNLETVLFASSIP